METMEKIVVFFHDYSPIFSAIGAACTAVAALFSIAVAIRAMKRTDLEIKRLEKQLSQAASGQQVQSFVGHWIDSPKVSFFLMLVGDTTKAFLLLFIIQQVVSFLLADRDSDGAILPVWWLLRQTISTGAVFFLFWPIVRSLGRFRAIVLGEPVAPNESS